MKAADIDDVAILRAVQDISEGIGASRWAIGAALGSAYPEKVVLAKLHALVRRGLLEGCACGCRGDFWVVGDPRDTYAWWNRTDAPANDTA